LAAAGIDFAGTSVAMTASTVQRTPQWFVIRLAVQGRAQGRIA
jgi:hypothetical protein